MEKLKSKFFFQTNCEKEILRNILQNEMNEELASARTHTHAHASTTTTAVHTHTNQTRAHVIPC